MASSAAPANEDGQTPPATPRSRLSNLRLSNRVSLILKPKAKKPEAEDTQAGTEPEKTVKKDLEVPLYRRYASFRSRTPSVHDGATSPKEEDTTANKEMTGTAAVEAEKRPEGESVAVEEPAKPALETTEAKPEPTTTFPTKATDKEEKPLPDPKPLPEPVPSRTRRLSGKVSKLLNVLPKSRGEGKDDAGPSESTGRRLLDKVGNIVNRKSKAAGEPSEKKSLDVDHKEEEGEPPALPPKSGEQAADDTQEASKPTEDPVSEEQKGEAKPTEESKPQEPAPAATKTASTTSVTAKATKIARRLSARGLGNVFQSKAKTDAEAPPPVSKASLVAQQLATPSNEEPKVAGAEPQGELAPAAAEATSEGTGEKTLPPPPAGEESTTTPSSTTKEKAPPSSFKAAGQIARRLSTRASDLFKPKSEGPASPSAEGSAPTDGEWTSIDAEEGKAAPLASTTPEASSTSHQPNRDRPAGLVRKISHRAQGAIAKARTRTKGEHGEAKHAGGETDSKGEVKALEDGAEAAAGAEQVAKSSEGEEEEAKDKPQGEPVSEQASPAEGAEPISAVAPEVPVESSSDAKVPEDPSTPEDTKQPKHVAEKTLPTPPPSAFSISGLGSRLSGLFGSTPEASAAPASKDDPATTGEASKEEPTPVEGEPSTAPADTKDATIPAEEEGPKAQEVETQAKEPVPAESEVAAAEPKAEEEQDGKSPEAPVAETETEVKASEAKVEPAGTKYSTDKSLPSPPPSAAAASFARVGKLSRRLSSRVGAAFKAKEGKTVEDDKKGEEVEASSKAEGTKEGGVEDKVEKDEGEVKVGTGEEASTSLEAAAEDGKGTEEEAKPVEDVPVLPPKDEVTAAPEIAKEAPSSSSAPPPPAFKGPRTKLGKRLSARVGDLFKSMSTPKDTKEGEKAEVAPPPPLPAKDAEKAQDDAVVEGAKGEDDRAEAPVAANEERQAAPEEDKGEGKAATGEEVSASKEGTAEEGQATVEGEVKPVEDPPVLPPKDETSPPEAAKEASPSSSAPPPTAFKGSKSKIGRRLSARVGDLFKSRSSPKDTKENDKAEGQKSDPTPPPLPTKDAEKAEKHQDDVVVEGAKSEDNQAEEAVASAANEEQVAAPQEKDKEEAEIKQESDHKDEEPQKDAGEVETETNQPEASTSTPAPEPHAEASAEKPLPSKPSRSARAKEAAADVGRQLSIRASGLMKPRPKLEEVVGRSPSAYSGAEKPAEGRRSRDGAGPGSLGRRLSRKVVDGILGQGKDSPEVEEGGKDEFVVVPKEDSEAPASTSEAKPAEAAGQAPESTSSDDAKNSSVEAVEGGAENPEDARKPVVPSKTGESKVEQNGAKSSPALASRVTGFLKQKLPEKILSPKDGEHAHEEGEGKDTKSGSASGSGERRRRRLSLGLRSKKKKEKKGGETAVAPPELPPKDAEGEKRVEKDLPVPEEGAVEAKDAVEERDLPVAPASDTSIPADGEEPKPAVAALVSPATA